MLINVEVMIMLCSSLPQFPLHGKLDSNEFVSTMLQGELRMSTNLIR